MIILEELVKDTKNQNKEQLSKQMLKSMKEGA
jgi:hypothetical protein